MDRLTYDATIDPTTILERTLRESAGLIDRWHGRDDGRLQYAVTPRFAVSCTADLLRESAALAASTGAYWQTHVSEDRGEIEEVARLFPEAIDYVDVYDRAGGLGERTVLAHAVHLSDRELARLVETGTRVAHCPASNLFLASGVMPLGAVPRGGPVGRSRVGRRGRAGPVDLHGDAGRRLREERARDRGRRPRTEPDAARLAADRHAGRGDGARARRPHRLARGRQGGRPDRGRSVVRGADPGRHRRRARRPREPPHLPVASRTWSAAPGSAAAASRARSPRGG